MDILFGWPDPARVENKKPQAATCGELVFILG
jgi:hypothetical protein